MSELKKQETAAGTKKWAVMDSQQRLRYVFRVFVMVMTMGMAFPNAVVE
ncbi:hypothetical protein [Lacisediminimonas profundi]|nr:hypothetical protein [Lacisediminimonas profundi]